MIVIIMSTYMLIQRVPQTNSMSPESSRSHIFLSPKKMLEIQFEGRVCRQITHLLRGIDDTGVVAELQGADHGCSNTHHQRERYLLQDKREKRKLLTVDRPV